MTLTIEPTQRDAAILEKEAQRRGLPVEQLANQLFTEMIEELEDADDAARILSKTNPKTWHSLEELRKVVRG